MPLSWEWKTKDHAIIEGKKTVWLSFDSKICFRIQDELYESDEKGYFDFRLDSDFVSNMLGCKEDALVTDVCKKAINHIFTHRVIFVDDNTIDAPLYVKCDVYFSETKTFLSKIGVKKSKCIAEVCNVKQMMEKPRSIPLTV